MQGACNHQDRWTRPDHLSEEVVQSVLKGGASRLKAPCDLAWSNLGCTVLDTATHRQKAVLHNNAGSVVPGEMCALVGPSGAGEYPSQHCNAKSENQHSAPSEGLWHLQLPDAAPRHHL